MKRTQYLDIVVTILLAWILWDRIGGWGGAGAALDQHGGIPNPGALLGQYRTNEGYRLKELGEQIP